MTWAVASWLTEAQSVYRSKKNCVANMTMNQIYASRDWGSITAVSALLTASKYRGRIVRHDT